MSYVNFSTGLVHYTAQFIHHIIPEAREHYRWQGQYLLVSF